MSASKLTPPEALFVALAAKHLLAGATEADLTKAEFHGLIAAWAAHHGNGEPEALPWHEMQAYDEGITEAPDGVYYHAFATEQNPGRVPLTYRYLLTYC